MYYLRYKTIEGIPLYLAKTIKRTEFDFVVKYFFVRDKKLALIISKPLIQMRTKLNDFIDPGIEKGLKPVYYSGIFDFFKEDQKKFRKDGTRWIDGIMTLEN